METFRLFRFCSETTVCLVVKEFSTSIDKACVIISRWIAMNMLNKPDKVKICQKLGIRGDTPSLYNSFRQIAKIIKDLDKQLANSSLLATCLIDQQWEPTISFEQIKRVFDKNKLICPKEGSRIGHVYLLEIEGERFSLKVARPRIDIDTIRELKNEALIYKRMSFM